MHRLIRAVAALAAVATAVPLSDAVARDPIGPPSLEAAVASGALPPVTGRLPSSPRVIDLARHGLTPGRHGGRLRMLMGGQKDLRMTYYYGYARLVCFNRDYRIEPDILESVDVEQGRIFTFRLRPGHKWSDGAAFTAEDFRYTWEDVLNNEKLSGSLPATLLVDGRPPVFEVVDALTVRYAWHAPNAELLPALAGALPLTLALPSHYLKQFHERYADKAALKARLAAANARNWRALHKRKGRITRPEDPELPVLDPWVLATPPPASLFVFRRNPYFHRIDSAGRQLPYIDEIAVEIGSSQLIPAKTGAGDSDLQARYLRFDNYTFLKAAEKRGVLDVRLWDRGEGSRIALIPNLTTQDLVWRTVLRDVRVRRALSLAIERREINQAIFYGLAHESADTVLPSSPLYRKEYAEAYAHYDPEEANRLLDAAGLDQRAFDGTRLLPDGRRAEMVVESAGESTEEADVLELIRETWREIGIVIHPRPTQRDLFRQRVYAGRTVMSVWSGRDNALPTTELSPARLAPVAQDQLQWPAWGHHYETKGEKGEAPDMPEATALLEALAEWRAANTDAARAAAWHRMLSIHAEQVFTIGTVNRTKQPVTTAPELRNVPKDAIFAYEPGAYFGVFQPDTFWFDRADTAGR